MGVIAAEYRCCLAVSNDLRDGVQAVLGRVRRLPHPDQRVNAGGVQRVFTVDYARPAQAQHGVGFVNGDELFAQIGEVCVDERIAHRLLAADVLVDAGGRHIGLCGQRTVRPSTPSRSTIRLAASRILPWISRVGVRLDRGCDCVISVILGCVQAITAVSAWPRSQRLRR